VINFLELDQLAGDLLYNQPQLRVSQKCEKGIYVTHCVFVPRHSLYVLILGDQGKSKSWIEIYAFKRTGVIQDNYVIRSSF
jgi:hypothetical protein